MDRDVSRGRNAPSMSQAISYFVVGSAATLVHIGTALTLNAVLGVSPLWSNFFAFLCAWMVSYAANWKWTFAAASQHRSSVPRFFAISLAGFMLNQALVYVFAIMLGWPFWMALGPVIFVVPLMSYIASKFWAFVPRDDVTASGTRMAG